jgi:hypothetical protein
MRVRLSSLLLVACALGFQGTAWAAGNLNGVAGSMPAYYDHELFTINLFQLSQAQATLLQRNTQQNTIYMSDGGLPGGQPFISVLDAILADGFNPLWAEVQIAFTPGHTPRQLFSDDEIAAAAASGEITLTPTNEMYRCSVIGKPSASGSGSGALLTAGASSATRTVSTTSAASAPSTPVNPVASWGEIKASYR